MTTPPSLPSGHEAPDWEGSAQREGNVPAGSDIQFHIEELRNAIREIAGRQISLENQLKRFDESQREARQSVEELREDGITMARARAVDDNRTKQQIQEIEQRLDDTLRPMRSMQAQVTEMSEDSRERVDDIDLFEKRILDMQSIVDHVRALGERGATTIQGIKEASEGHERAIDALRKEIMINEDAIRIVEQDTRRRNDEITEAGSTVEERVEDLRSELRHVFDLIEDARRSTVHIDPAIEELKIRDGELDQAILQGAELTVERDDRLSQRIEEIQGMAEEQFADLRQGQDQRLEHLDRKIEEVAEHFQGIDDRISSLSEELNELRLTDDSLRRDLWNLHEQRVRLRLEQAQQELEQVSGLRKADRPDTPLNSIPVPRPGDR